MTKSKQSLHESNQYNDPSFPFGMYTINRTKCIPKGRGYKDLHWHEELQFTLVITGEIIIKVNGIDYSLKQGEAIFMNSGLLHITTYISQNANYVSFNFPYNMLSYFPGSRMEQSYVLPYTSNYTFPVTVFKSSIHWQNDCLCILWSLKEIMNNDKDFGWEYIISLKITQLWFLMLKNTFQSINETPKSFIRNQERIQLLLTFMHENYSEDISLQDIANAAHVSVGECTRCFKNIIHTTPYEYLLDYRISKSMELLARTDYTVSEIAGRVGFNQRV